jgi:hypothetical protein
VSSIPWGKKFHVKLAKDNFLPARPYQGTDEPYDYFYESDGLDVSAALRDQIESGIAKFVRIEDKTSDSVLSKLERFAYFPEGITFVLHAAEQPYLLCLIGEQVTDETWRKAHKVVSALLREHFDRGKAGRPPKIGKMKKGIMLRNLPGPLKEKAFALIPKAGMRSNRSGRRRRIPIPKNSTRSRPNQSF